MKVLILGAGAVGGYFGARLIQSGRDVTFLARARRAEQLRSVGIRIVKMDGSIETVPARTITADNIDSAYDLVIVAVKSFALPAALADVEPAVSTDTVVVPLLNGIAHLDKISDALGTGEIYGGTCRLATQTNDRNDIVQLGTPQSLRWGTLDGRNDGRLPSIRTALTGAGFDAECSDTIYQDMWEKWMFLAALGAICTLMRGSIGDVNSTSGGTDLVKAVIDEVVTVANASGNPPRPQCLRDMQDALTDPDASTTSSLYRDLLQNRRLEADQILGDLTARASGFEIDTPLLSLAQMNLSVYEIAGNRREVDR
ncbi:ketopantoate reductase family protein [Rhodococcus sp. P1Y]|uniref:ketopantoate reductase family protein n=1 Tax=Rhodococcus sp. P1Y TaxID=1302308 RepID=UPI0013795283|nr:ketopantoate reductase family protein [Rhodococcus sp. P1Y]